MPIDDSGTVAPRIDTVKDVVASVVGSEPVGTDGIDAPLAGGGGGGPGGMVLWM